MFTSTIPVDSAPDTYRAAIQAIVISLNEADLLNDCQKLNLLIQRLADLCPPESHNLRARQELDTWLKQVMIGKYLAHKQSISRGEVDRLKTMPLKVVINLVMGLFDTLSCEYEASKLSRCIQLPMTIFLDFNQQVLADVNLPMLIGLKELEDFASNVGAGDISFVKATEIAHAMDSTMPTTPQQTVQQQWETYSPQLKQTTPNSRKAKKYEMFIQDETWQRNAACVRSLFSEPRSVTDEMVNWIIHTCGTNEMNPCLVALETFRQLFFQTSRFELMEAMPLSVEMKRYYLVVLNGMLKQKLMVKFNYVKQDDTVFAVEQVDPREHGAFITVLIECEIPLVIGGRWQPKKFMVEGIHALAYSLTTIRTHCRTRLDWIAYAGHEARKKLNTSSGGGVGEASVISLGERLFAGYNDFMFRPHFVNQCDDEKLTSDIVEDYYRSMMFPGEIQLAKDDDISAIVEKLKGELMLGDHNVKIVFLATGQNHYNPCNFAINYLKVVFNRMRLFIASPQGQYGNVVQRKNSQLFRNEKNQLVLDTKINYLQLNKLTKDNNYIEMTKQHYQPEAEENSPLLGIHFRCVIPTTYDESFQHLKSDVIVYVPELLSWVNEAKQLIISGKIEEPTPCKAPDLVRGALDFSAMDEGM
mgnify:CR=1 FL=1|tara:strand:+ start:24156 stop:26084 length:1929 start_codon:yes stop_codon:yes gene_type:complete